MPSRDSEIVSKQFADLVKAAWQDIGIRLENRKRQIFETIRNYPPPITACDQQFDYLLEQQAGISRELGRMHDACQESLARNDAIEIIDEFIRSSNCLDDDSKQSIQANLQQGLMKR